MGLPFRGRVRTVCKVVVLATTLACSAYAQSSVTFHFSGVITNVSYPGGVRGQSDPIVQTGDPCTLSLFYSTALNDSNPDPGIGAYFFDSISNGGLWLGAQLGDKYFQTAAVYSRMTLINGSAGDSLTMSGDQPGSILSMSMRLFDPTGRALHSDALPLELNRLPWDNGNFIAYLSWGTMISGVVPIPEPTSASLGLAALAVFLFQSRSEIRRQPLT